MGRACRLYRRMEKAKARSRAAQYVSDVDPKTGRLFFRPHINRSASAGRRNSEGLPVGEYLYGKWCALGLSHDM